jgi:hypothetical protein
MHQVVHTTERWLMLPCVLYQVRWHDDGARSGYLDLADLVPAMPPDGSEQALEAEAEEELPEDGPGPPGAFKRARSVSHSKPGWCAASAWAGRGLNRPKRRCSGPGGGSPGGTEGPAALRGDVRARPDVAALAAAASEKDAVSAQKLAQLHLFVAVFFT